MFRVSYINENNEIMHKGGFASDKEAIEWMEAHPETVTPLKLLVWSEYLQCYRTIETYAEI